MDIWHVLLLSYIFIQYIKSSWKETEIHNKGFDLGYQVGQKHRIFTKIANKTLDF